MESTQSQPWAEFFKQWQDTVFSGAPAANTSDFQRVFSQGGEQFLNMMQQFYQATGQARPLDQMASEWTENLKKFYTDSLHASTQPFDVSESYKPFMENMLKGSQAWGASFQAGKNPFSAFDPLGSFTTMPGLGMTRDKQEQTARLYKLWVDFQQKSRRYDAGMAKVGLDAARQFQDFLISPPAGQEPLTSLKAVYAKWIDICEDVYGRYAMSDEYIRTYGDSVNALMALKREQDQMTDGVMEQMNLPTRREVDSLHERMHALRRENIQLRKDLEELKSALKPKAAKAAAKTVKPAKKRKKS